MALQPDHSIIAELEDAVRTGSPAERVETLRQVTNLFLHDGARLNEEQVKIFDDVMCLLIAGSKAAPGPNSASGWRRSRSRRRKSCSSWHGTMKSLWPATC